MVLQPHSEHQDVRVLKQMALFDQLKQMDVLKM